MAKAYIQISAKFTVITNSVAGDISALCAEICEKPYVQLGAFDDNPNFTTSFEILPKGMVSGATKMTDNGENVEVEINGIAEVSVKTEHLDTFLSKSTNWRLNGLSGVWIGDFSCEGLEKVDFMAKRRGKEIEDSYYSIDLVASKNK